jgi:preprotein translocase subunit SecY
MNDAEPEQDVLSSRVLDSIIQVMPKVEPPRIPVLLKNRLLWSVIALVMYFILGEITVYGITEDVQDYFSFFRAVLASRSGTLITLGIGPVVTAGIFMQLFQGAEIFHFDLTSHQGRSQYQGIQKMLALFLCFFEAAVYVFVGAFGSYGVGREIFLTLQIGIGAALVVMMDEVVTKWGFGSGISLFIAGGVSRDIFWKLFSFQGSPVHEGEMIGAIPGFIHSLIQGTPVLMRSNLPDMVEVAFTLLIFVIVVYFESLWIDVPLSLGRFRGTRGGYPVKFTYTSVIPVIFTMSVFAIYQFFARAVGTRLGTGIFGQFDASGSAVGGIMYYISPPRGILQVANDPYRAVAYVVVVVILCACFAMMWASYTGMDSKSVAQKIQRAGVQVAGFQRDIRVYETILDKYIPQVTIMGGIAVGLLAATADFTGALGTGTGILLAVSIVYRMYIDLLRDPDLPERARKMLTG